MVHEKYRLWRRNFVVSMSILVAFLILLYLLNFFNSAVVSGTLLIVLLVNLVYSLELVGVISHSTGANAFPFCYLIPVNLMVLTTGGFLSPMLTCYWAVFTVSFSSVPETNVRLIPTGLGLLVSYITVLYGHLVGWNLNAYPLSATESAVTHMLVLAMVTLSAVGRGENFRNLTRHALTKERLANEAKSRFLATVSHEMRTPLTTILGWMEVLLREHHEDAIRNKLLIVQNSGEHLLTIINDVLDYSKIETGKLGLEQHTFHLASIIKKTTDSNSVLVKPGVTFNVDINLAEDLAVVGDSKRITQIIYNFISNAIKFTNEGEIELGVWLGRVNDVEGLVQIQFRCRDTGIGMEQEALSRLFQPFTQADSSMSRKFGGTGLGLSIAKELIDLMRGSVSVQSKPHEGTTFEWCIWLKSAEADRNSTGAYLDDSPPTYDIGGLKRSASGTLSRDVRILLVEDNKFNQRLMTEMLESVSFVVSTANNGLEAVDMAQQKEYDLILMDFQMPLMDGIQATTRLRQLGITTPIVGLTANSDDHSRMDAQDCGMDAFVAKPVKIADLREVVEKTLKERVLGGLATSPRGAF